MLDVILLEDEPVLRQELGEFLEELGYAPRCVSSLQEFDLDELAATLAALVRCLMSQPGENISRRQIIEALGFD